MLKGGRAILFKAKMTDPGKAVSNNRKCGQYQKITRKKEKYEQSDYSARPDEMQLTACHIGVLAQVIRIKITKALEFHRNKLPYPHHNA
jgi:hypothetical protein